MNKLAENHSNMDNLPNSVIQILKYLASPNLLQNNLNRIEMCKRGLKHLSMNHNPIVWAYLQAELAAYIAESQTNKSDLEKAVFHSEQALLVYSATEHPKQWALVQHNLANIYSERICGSKVENLEVAKKHCEQALSIWTYDLNPKDWAMCQTTFGNIYVERLIGGRSENIEVGIEHFNLALSKISKDDFPELWAIIQNNLGTAFRYRFIGERHDNQNQAIHYFKNALTIFTFSTYPLDWGRAHHNLGTIYRLRIHGDKISNIEQAINHYQQALRARIRSKSPYEWAETQNNLGVAYIHRLVGSSQENIEQAISHINNALKIFTAENYPEQWAMSILNLATAYHDRVLGTKSNNLEKTIQLNQQLLIYYHNENMYLDLALTHNNLAHAFADRKLGNDEDNFNQSVFHFNEALKIYHVDKYPGQRLLTQKNLGHVFYERQQWADVIKAYQSALEISKKMLSTAYTEGGRRAEISETIHISARSAYCLWQINQPAAALQKLERGKTLLLSEALFLEQIDVIQLSMEQQHRLHKIRHQIATLEGEMRQLGDAADRKYYRDLTIELHQAREALNKLLGTIKQVNLGYIPSNLEVSDILALIPSGGALVAPFITSHGGAVFVIPYNTTSVTNAHILPLPTLTTDYLFELLQGIKNDSTLSGVLDTNDRLLQNEDYNAQDNWFQQTIVTTSKLWDSLMEPIHKRLQTLNLSSNTPILLIPQGGLGLLPLHAAWRLVDGQPRYFCDDYTVTYTPSAYALHVSRQRATHPERQSRSLFAAINPTCDLKHALLEGEAIAQEFTSSNQTILYGGNANTNTFPSSTKGHAYIHYAGHSSYNWRDPLQSGLQLADKAYTLSDVLNGLDLSACRLVTLSACETGITESQKAPDEYVGLSAGFLQAGAPAVISTLWAVNDLSTMLLIERFYQLHLQNGLEFASALRQAQLWLRDVTAGELAERFDQAQMKLKGNKSAKARVSEYWRRLKAEEPENKLFAHPYYWAAFTFIGA